MTDREAKRFWKSVNKIEDGCWEWTAGLFNSGYGQFWTKATGPVAAHRFIYQVMNGDIESSKIFVCHHCDNRKCVRPDHLFLGTNKENMDDRKNKGLGRVVGEKGELHTLAKLTEELVIWARAEYNRGRTGKEIAKELGISPTTISRALKGITWSHVPGAIAEDMYQRGDRHHHKGGRSKI